MARVMKAPALPDLAAVVGALQPARAWIDDEPVRQRATDQLTTGLIRESWKYTPIKGFLEALAETPVEPVAALAPPGQPGLRAVPFEALTADDGTAVRRLIAERLCFEHHPLADLALLRARAGWFVRVSGQVAQPLAIRFPERGVVPVFVLLEANAALTIVEEPHHAQPHPGGDQPAATPTNPGLLAQVIHVELAPGARLVHERAALDRDTAHYSAISVRLARDAHYRLRQSAVGARQRRLEVHTLLEDDGAEVEMGGAYLVEDRQHLDQQLLVEHRAGHTTSHQKFHGIGAGKSRSVFNGRIHIHPHAPQSNADLTNRNLALHADAEMNTKPELEIYTDDVRCSHGATVGQLADDALFFLTARGIPQIEARRLLAHGFVRECLSGQLAEPVLARLLEGLQ